MNDSKFQRLSTYLARGWPLLPLHWVTAQGCSCNSPNCRSPGKHPRITGGFKSASTSLSQVKSWHKTWPQANWGLRTGDRAEGGAGILVVDLDPKNGGFETWQRLCADPLDTITVQTGNLGRHLWFEFPSGSDIRCNAGGLGLGVDIRANRGYVLVPPSRTTYAYRFEVPLEMTHLAPLPAWLLPKLDQRPAQRSSQPRGDELVQPGERHQALVSLAMEMHRRGLKPAQIITELKAARDSNFAEGDHPVSDEEIIRVVDWTCQQVVEFKCTDLGNAERYRAQHWEQVRHCPEWGAWLVWNGRRWVVGDRDGAMHRGFNTVRAISQEAEALEDEYKRAARKKHAFRSESAPRVESMLRMAKTLLGIAPAALDRHPDLLNVGNGILNLRTGELLPHDPSWMLTRLIEVDYHPEAGCPEWLKFLDLVTGGDQGLARFLQTAVGYSLTGHIDEHVLFFLFGAGSNGKTTFMETIQSLMGDYYRRVPVETLMQTFPQGQAATPYTAEFAGARLVVSSEVPENRKLNEPLVKDLTGGDLITARHLYGNPFTFQLTHKLWMFGNHKPRITGSDEGIWRRMRVVPFRITIPPGQRRPQHQVLAAFKSELEGILAWAVGGGLRWYRDGLDNPAAVARATSSYRSDQDLVGQFLEECCLRGPDLRVKKDDLYQAWRTWCQDSGESEAMRRSKKWLTYQMLAQGLEQGGAGNYSLIGIGLLG